MLKKLGDVLQLDKHNKIDIKDDGEYSIAGVQSYGKGVVIRRSVVGKELTMKQYQVIKKDQLMWCKVDTKNGAFGLTKEEHMGSLASTNMALANIDTSKILPNFLETLFQISSFHGHITKYSSGSTNRKYLTPQQLFELIEIPDFSIEEQKKFIQRVESIRKSGLAEEIEIRLNLVSKLRQTILQEAIEGKLTEQWRQENPDVEPVSKLLEKIKIEKERLIKEKKLKNKKELSEINNEDTLFHIPDYWSWCRLDDIVGLYNGSVRRGPFGSAITKDMFVPKGNNTYKVYEQKNAIQKDAFLGQYYISEKHFLSLKSFEVKVGDIIISCAGTIGETYILPSDIQAGIINQALLKIGLNNHMVLNEYFIHLFSALTKKKVNDDATGSAMKNMVSLDYIRANVLFPIPPIEEQVAILHKINELFKVCDDLEDQISSSKINTDRLMQAVLKEAFEEEPKIATTEPHVPKTFQRSVLAAYLIDNSQDDPFFGHVKLQKMLFMCEAVNNLDFDTDYKRHAMGPYDPKLIRSVDSQLKKAKWFEVKKLEGEISRYVYHPLEKVEEYKKYVGRYWDHKKIEHIFQLMKPMRTLQAEIVATLYSANSDLKKTNISITDAILINEARNNWHDNKKNIAVETWEKAIEWMKSKNLL